MNSSAPDEEAVEAGSAPALDHDSTKRAIDELFHATKTYRSSKDYAQLIQFISRFRSYSPFNAMLIHIQMPGACFVAPPDRWAKLYERTIKPGARPLVILRPMGPVMFVFDVSDTEGAALPPEVVNPFAARKGQVGNHPDRTIENAKRDGVHIHLASLGSQAAGSIRAANPPRPNWVFFRDVAISVRYELEINGSLSPEAQYATIAHELAHLYCGHLGTPNVRWWPDRQDLDGDRREFEAESITYLLCARLGIDNPSERYLAIYLQDHAEAPPISLECVVKAAGLIESMGREPLPLRKEK